VSEPQRRLALRIHYDGADFAGSQWQPHSPTVQSALEHAIAHLTRETQRIEFAGRTDAGVHATGQVVALTTAADLSPQRWLHGLNHFLPATVAVQAAQFVPPGFHPRQDARERTYHYHLRLAPHRQPLVQRAAWVVPGPLQLDRIRAALPKLLGEHDFASFAARPAHSGTRRTITEASVHTNGAQYCFRFRATAFLPHQVRRTVGLLERIGRGHPDPACIDRLLADPQVGSAGPAAPPHGLVLTHVRYDVAALAEWSDDIENLCWPPN
jgi:tRNA pseudouridine38-40 synthase